jgi:hypothetical protein
MARHSSSMMRDGHTRIAPVPALSARADEAIKEQDKGVGGRNAHDLGLDAQLNARFAHGLREDDWMEKS